MVEKQNSEKRGGKRVGSGRKKIPDKKIAMTFKLSPEIVEILREQDNMTEFIEESVKRNNP